MTQGESVKRAQVVLEVVAGLIPGEAMEEYTRRWSFSRAELEAGDDAAYQEAQAMAEEYAESLRHPAVVNWVRLDWVWL